MKKIFSILLLVLAICSNSIKAQPNTICNAEFTTQQFTGNLIKFNPVTTGDSTINHHYWVFGDGGISSLVSPLHSYTNSGTYTVKHILYRTTLAGTVDCIDSAFGTVQIQASCNLIASFYSYRDTTLPTSYIYHFENTSIPLSLTDSIRWTFGDGTSSNEVSPDHNFTAPGTFIVCLRVQKRDANGGLTNCIRETCNTLIVSPSPCFLSVNFFYERDTITTIPYTYHFQSVYYPVASNDSLRWTFGDGSSSNDLNPSHSYAQAGTYTVCFRVQKRDPNGGLTNCIMEICKNVLVTGSGTTCNLIANFVISFVPNVPGTYHFENTSVPLNNTDSIQWNFGDGLFSNQVSPDHTYTLPGTYLVCLRVESNPNCVSYFCDSIVVQTTTPPVCNIQANFTWQTNPSNISIIHFTNLTTVPTSASAALWSFGDGSSSTIWSPSHTYAQAGNYIVCLRVESGPNCVSYFCDSITVQAPACNIQANFTWQVDPSNESKIHFTNLSSTPTSASGAVWSFGDGSSSTTWNPVHTYAQPGNYIVCLQVHLLGTNCTSYFCDSITVQGSTVNCIQLSEFSVIQSSSNSQLFYFTPLHIMNTAGEYRWTFGDGTGSDDLYASHHYTQPGNYTACLSFFHDSTCASTTCKPVNATYQLNCDSVHVSYTYQHDPTIVNKLFFHTISNYTVIDETWTITRISGTTSPSVILHQNDPYYIFQDTGYYVVCLQARTLGNCIKDECQTIHISQVTTAPNCTLQVYPNPASSQVSVNVYLAQPQMINVYIYNSVNVLVQQNQQAGTVGSNVVTTSIANLVAGYYTMKVIHGNDICYAQFLKL